MRTRPFYIIGNWKSNKTLDEAISWFQDFSALWKKQPLRLTNIKIILCPSSIHLSTLKSIIELSGIPLLLGAQDASAFPIGAYTGDVAADMLKNLVAFSLVGHSERRKYHHETEEQLSMKVELLQKAQIVPVYCVQNAEMVVPGQCEMVGYEPVWAIGTGKPDTAANANMVAEKIKTTNPFVKNVIYGGSVTAKNVAEYALTTALDGVLPGGASLDPVAFFELITHAATA